MERQTQNKFAHHLLNTFKSPETLKVEDLIETALSLDVGLYNHLPAACRQPGIAGLCSYRLIADACRTYQEEHKDAFSPEIQSFLKKVNNLSQEALTLLKNEGPQAPIKNLINQLMEHCGGYQRIEYTPEEFGIWKSVLAPLSNKKTGQLVYRQFDGRFFVLVDPGYIDLAQDMFEKQHGYRCNPSAYIGHAHFTINDGMNKEISEQFFKKFRAEYGLFEAGEQGSLYFIEKPGLIYIKHTLRFEVMGAYSGQAKTNSRMKSTHQWQIQSDDLEVLNQSGLASTYQDYFPHITFAEDPRHAHPILEQELPNRAMVSLVLAHEEPSHSLKQYLWYYEAEQLE